MKNINFIKTGMTNFCCYIDQVIYEFNNSTISLITGPNGSGKTTIFDSICYTLFGITTKGLRSEDVINNIVNKNCHTFIEFTIEESGITNNYRVDRYCKDSNLGDTVLLFKNDFKRPIKKGQKEVLPEIEKLLIPQKLFLNTLLFGQKVKNFFTDLTDSEQKEIFRKVLQLDDYVLYYDETSNRIKVHNLELENLNKQIFLNENLLKTTEEKSIIIQTNIKNFEIKKKEDINIFQNNINQFKNILIGLEEEAKKFQNISKEDLEEKTNQKNEMKNEIDTISMQYRFELDSLLKLKQIKEAEFNSKISEMISKENEIKHQLIQQINSESNLSIFQIQENIKNVLITKKERQSQLTINSNEINRILSDIKKLEESINRDEPICPTCGKEITDHSLKEHLKTELKSKGEFHKKLEFSNSEVEKSVKNLIEEERSLKKLADELLGEKDKKIKEVEDLNFNTISKFNIKKRESIEKLNKAFNEKKEDIENKFKKKISDLENLLKQKMIEIDGYLKIFIEKDILLEKINNIKIEILLETEKLKNKENEEYNGEILENYFAELNRLKNEKEYLLENKDSLEEDINILEFWKSAFSSSGIPSLLIDESIPFLNSSVSAYLEKIGGRYIVSFDTISTTKSGEYRDKINVNVLDTKTKANHRKQFSGGQTRIVDIAILLSLCDLQNSIQNMKSNILLLDEIFDSLDDENIGYISNLLRSLLENKSISIISHRHIDSIEADQIIRLF